MRLVGFAGAEVSEDTAESWRRYVERIEPNAPVASTAEPALRGCASGPHLASGGRQLVALRGDVQWRNGSGLADGRADPAQAVLALYRQHGEGFLDHLMGSFAVAIIDGDRRRVLLAVDRMGVERMTYAVRDGVLAFGTSAEQLARSPVCQFAVNKQGLYDFLLMHMIPAPQTIFEGVHKLRPGTAAIFTDGRLEVRSYWRPQFAEGRSGDGDFPDWKAGLHEALREAVVTCDPDERTGSFLSGGLDSSSVSGMLAKVNGGRTRTFSIGFGVDAYDELRYARIANEHFGCQPFEYHVTAEDVVTAFPLIARAYDEPFGNSSAVPTYFCALKAREQGMSQLLAGDGGDEIFGGNERYVRQGVFEAYYQVPTPLRRGVIEPLSRLIPAEGGLMPLRKLRSYVDQARIRLPERLESWNLVYRTPLADMLEPEFQRSIDPRAPFAVMEEVYEAAPARSMLHKMLYYDWHFTLSDNDLRKVGTMCELAGIKVRYPMLDQRVVDVSLRIPPGSKIRGMQLRAFYKRAMSEFLPREILEKTKHGFGLPFGVWLKTHEPLRELIFGHLENLKARRLVRARFIDQLVEGHREGHASYFGYAIWDLAILEAWLAQHTV